MYCNISLSFIADIKAHYASTLAGHFFRYTLLILSWTSFFFFLSFFFNFTHALNKEMTNSHHGLDYGIYLHDGVIQFQ